MKLNQFLQNGSDFILDLLFPRYCVGCGQEGSWLCSNCRSKILLIKSPTCPYCFRLSKHSKVCNRCRAKSNLTGLVVAAHYKNGPLKEAIHTYKYDGVYRLSNQLSEILIQALRTNKVINGDYLIIPVPLHKHKRAERGFNQVELIARQISQKLNYRLINNKLIKIKNTSSQMTLSGQERRNNLQNCFKWVGDNQCLKNKSVILVDDVFTTGSTLEECARILRIAGAREVWGLVLAKA